MLFEDPGVFVVLARHWFLKERVTAGWFSFLFEPFIEVMDVNIER